MLSLKVQVRKKDPGLVRYSTILDSQSPFILFLSLASIAFPSTTIMLQGCSVQSTYIYVPDSSKGKGEDGHFTGDSDTTATYIPLAGAAQLVLFSFIEGGDVEC